MNTSRFISLLFVPLTFLLCAVATTGCSKKPSYVVYGAVKSVSVGQGRLAIRTSMGKDEIVHVGSNVVVKDPNGNTSLSDLKVGSIVAVAYHSFDGGTVVASGISVASDLPSCSCTGKCSCEKSKGCRVIRDHDGASD